MLRFEKTLQNELDELKKICKLKKCIKIGYDFWDYNDKYNQTEGGYTIWIEDTKQHYYFETYWDIMNFVEKKQLLFKKF